MIDLLIHLFYTSTDIITQKFTILSLHSLLQKKYLVPDEQSGTQTRGNRIMELLPQDKTHKLYLLNLLVGSYYT